MPQLVQQPSIIPPPGQNPKLIEEYVGKVATGKEAVSIARTAILRSWRAKRRRGISMFPSGRPMMMTRCVCGHSSIIHSGRFRRAIEHGRQARRRCATDERNRWCSAVRIRGTRAVGSFVLGSAPFDCADSTGSTGARSNSCGSPYGR